jgi:RHS repeat-associated protein
MISKTGYNGTITYTYDNNGNTIEKRTPTETTTYTYDFENRLTKVTLMGEGGIITFIYDGDGNRVKKTDSEGTVNYLVDTNNNTGFSQVVLETDGTGNIITSYIYGDDLISQERSGVVSYFHYDGLGSTRNLTDSSGTTTDSYWYYGFGELLNKTGTTINNYLFTGEQIDQNLRFYYLRARYYNQEIGRFITADPVEGSIYEPISLHKYLYAGLDPVNKIDPSGEFIQFSLGFYISAGISVLTGSLIYLLFRPRISNVERITGGTSYYYDLLGAFEIIKNNSYNRAYSELLQMYGEGKLYAADISMKGTEYVAGIGGEEIYINKKEFFTPRFSILPPAGWIGQYYFYDVKLAATLIHELEHKHQGKTTFLCREMRAYAAEISFLSTVYENEGSVEWKRIILTQLIESARPYIW